MTRSKKLQPVVRHVENNEQSALKAVALSQQQLQQHQNQLSRTQLDKLLGGHGWLTKKKQLVIMKSSLMLLIFQAASTFTESKRALSSIHQRF